eukprot:TRINITY_DN2032_c0_g1_i1.p1 TRINITY_DN2032_c0_g1~~TRINITY_DN2032_c0_g1_i1.p1  ORF type:complete len:369 (-),score=78.95 TRINITY_DN2032_c0_g1_i1:1748-2854(-)
MYFQRQENDRQRGPYDTYPSHRGGKRKGYFGEQGRGGRGGGGWGVQERGPAQRPYKRVRGGGAGNNANMGRFGANSRGGRGDRGNGKGNRGNFRNWRQYRNNTGQYLSSGHLPLGRTPIHAPNAPAYHPTPLPPSPPDEAIKTGLSKEKEEERDREIAELDAMVAEGGGPVAGDDFVNGGISNGLPNIRQFIRVHGLPQDIQEFQNGEYIEIDQQQYALENDPELDPRIRDTLRQLRSWIADLEEENYDLRERLREVDPQYAGLQDEDEPMQEHSELEVEPQLNQVLALQPQQLDDHFESSQQGEATQHELQHQHEIQQQLEEQQHSSGNNSHTASDFNDGFQDESMGDQQVNSGNPDQQEQPETAQQ